MLPQYFVFFGVALNFFGNFGYIRSILKGKTQPNRVTWALWAIAPLIAFSAELSKGVGLSALMTFSAGFMPLLIFISSFVSRKAYWKIGPFDWLCGAFSVVALLLWYITGEGSIAIVLSILADLLAAIPTIVKSYTHPESEHTSAFLFGGINAGIALLTVTTWNVAQAGFPLYIALVCTLLFLLIKFPKIRLKSLTF